MNIIKRDNSALGVKASYGYYDENRNFRLHREDGPAVEWSEHPLLTSDNPEYNGRWFYHNQKVNVSSQQEFEAWLQVNASD